MKIVSSRKRKPLVDEECMRSYGWGWDGERKEYVLNLRATNEERDEMFTVHIRPCELNAVKKAIQGLEDQIAKEPT